MIDEREEMALISEAVGWEGEAERCLTELTTKKLEEAVNLLKGIKAMRKKIEETFKEPKQKADAAKAAILNAIRTLDGPLDTAEKIIKDKISLFYEAENKKRAEEYAERSLAARRSAEDMRNLEAGALADGGDSGAAEALLGSDLIVPAVPKPPSTKVTGVSTSERWHAEVESLADLLEFVADNPKWHHLVKVNMTEANKLATAQKDSFAIPGLKAVSKSSVAVRV